jgi:hypothetical protein
MGAKKKTGVDMGDHLPTASETEHMRWCVNNGIYISPKAKSTVEWYVIIELNKKISTSPETYKKVEIWKQIYKYYKYYYDKYKK